jgi:PAS domain S-box-containing protein
MFGIPSDTFVGWVEDFYGYVHPDDRQMVAKAVADARQTRKPYAAEFRVVRRDGMLRWVFSTGKFYYGTSGDAERMLGMATDITERKRAEEALNQKDKELAEAQRLAGVGGWQWEPRTDTVIWSKELYHLMGVDPTLPAPSYKEHAKLFTAESWERLQRGVQQALQTGTSYELDLEVVRPESIVKWEIARGEAVRDAGGQIVGLRGTVQDITERKRTEETLRESEERFRLAVQAGKMYAFDWNVVTDEIVRSAESADILNWERPEHDTGRKFHARIHPDDLALYTAMEAGLTRENPAYQMTFRTLNPEGRITWLEDTGRASFDPQGKMVRVTGTVADITERRRVEEALKKSEEKFSKAFQQSPMALALTSARDHRYIDVNETFERITGWRRDEVVGRTPLDIGLWVNPAERFEIVKRLLTERSLRNLENSFRMKDGSIRNGLSSAELIELDGEPCILGVTADVTDYKRSQDALRQSEARERARVKELEAILDAVPVPVLIAHDVECRYITGNRAASEQLREARGQNLSQSAPPGERPAFRQIKNGVEIPADLLPMQQAAATGKPIYQRELTLLYEDGTTREEIANAVPFLDESGRPRGAVGASMDVTELKRTERALRESEDELRLLLDSTAEAIYGIDLEHRCTFCNPAGLRALGYERVDEVLGKNMHKLIHHSRADGTPFPEEECRIHRVTQTGEGVHSEDEVLWRANGTSFPTEYWSYPQRRGQEVVGAVVAFIDITERKLAEATLSNVSRKLIEAQEQERIRIGRELHDDIGQRLALLAVELQQLREHPLVVPRVRSRVGKLQKQVSQIANDTQSLSHQLHSAKLQYLGLTAAMRGFCRELSEQQKAEIDFKAHDVPDPLSEDISLCFFRVLQEALHNAVKHSGVGHFEVRLWGTSDEVHLTVKDSGAGFDREAAKATQGIGLISMEERVKLVNGTLSIESQPKRGATIHARVPLEWAGDAIRAAG